MLFEEKASGHLIKPVRVEAKASEQIIKRMLFEAKASEHFIKPVLFEAHASEKSKKCRGWGARIFEFDLYLFLLFVVFSFRWGEGGGMLIVGGAAYASQQKYLNLSSDMNTYIEQYI